MAKPLSGLHYKYPCGPYLGASDMIKYTLSANGQGLYTLTIGNWIGSESTKEIVLRHGIFTPEEWGYLKSKKYVPLFFLSGVDEYRFFPTSGYCIGQWYCGHDRILEARLHETAPEIYQGERITFTPGGWSR